MKHLRVLASILSALPLGSALHAQGFVECTRVLHQLEGEAAGDLFGWVSTPVPDVNGDGVQEFAVSAVSRDQGGANSGRIYLYDGRTGIELFHVDGKRANELFGYSMRDAGDLDGDGIGDLIAGGRASAGLQGVARVLSGVDGTQLLAIRMGAAGDSFGYSVAGVGDVDLDGLPDFAVGAILDDGAGTDAGRVYVVSGADGTTVLLQFAGDSAGDNFGSALGTLGDVTGDGRAELAVGAANAGTSQRGRAYVYDLASGTRLYTVAPDASGVEFGQFFAASAGLVDGDGFPDLYVGDYVDAGGRGKAYLFSGATGALIRRFTGSPGAGFGIGRPLGDLDGDGRTEIVLGSWTDSSGAALAGKAEVFSGATGALLRTVTSTTGGENFGYDAHGIGDVDGDGTIDMIVTAASFGASRGRVYVIAREPILDIGPGLAGSGGLVPRLSTTGCARPGAALSFEIADALGGAPATLVLAGNRADLPLRGGTLYPEPTGYRLRHALGGAAGVPGAGALSILLALPADPALVGLTFFAQALALDPGAPAALAFSNGLSLLVY